MMSQTARMMSQTALHERPVDTAKCPQSKSTAAGGDVRFEASYISYSTPAFGC